MVGLAVLVSAFNWYDFFERDIKWRWLGGVVFGLMAIIKFVDVVEDYRNKKNSKQDEQRTER